MGFLQIKEDGADIHKNFQDLLTACQTWNFQDEDAKDVMEGWLVILINPLKLVLKK